MDFLSVLIERYSLRVTAEALWAKTENSDCEVKKPDLIGYSYYLAPSLAAYPGCSCSVRDKPFVVYIIACMLFERFVLTVINEDY